MPDAAATTGRTVLQTKGLTIRFGGLVAVDHVDLDVPEGTITGLIGPNGAGKTTAFNMITGMYTPTSGSVTYTNPKGEQYELAHRSPEQIGPLGIARTFQNIRLFKDSPAIDNVKLGMHTRTSAGFFRSLLRWPARAEERAVHTAAYRYLEFVGLDHLAHELAGSLPYGAQRRLEIARALAMAPDVLLLDEPAAGMNPQETEDLMDTIMRIRDMGITVFLIEHDMKLVMGVCEKITVLNQGAVIAVGGPSDIANNPEVIKAYLGDEALG
ncbi:MAG: ABC transporter ATP-binding protein [Planctomycetota bacterium]